MKSITSSVSHRQLLLLVLTGIMFTIMLIYTYFNSKISTLLTLGLAICFFIYLNYLYSFIFHISIDLENDSFIIDNLYKRRTISKSDFKGVCPSIRGLNIFLPLPLSSPPYFRLETKDNGSFLFLYNNKSNIFNMILTSPNKQAQDIEREFTDILNN